MKEGKIKSDSGWRNKTTILPDGIINFALGARNITEANSFRFIRSTVQIAYCLFRSYQPVSLCALSGSIYTSLRLASIIPGP